jgi:hypothetical protein
MGIATYPAVSSPVKSIQRGSAVSAGNITINAVNTAKTMVNSFATSFSGTVAASGSINAANGSTSSANQSVSGTVGPFAQNGNINPGSRYSPGTQNPGVNATNTSNFSGTVNALNLTLNSTSLTGGSTNLAASGAYLTNSTTLTTTGACRYEVVEYY